MSVAIPDIATIKTTLVTAIRAKLLAALAGGTPIPPVFAPGDPLDALTDAQAVTELQWWGQLDYVQQATTFTTATGQDLLDLVAVVYTPPAPAKAIKPVLFGQNVVGSDTETVPVGLHVWGKDRTGAYTIGYTTLQDPTQLPGVAATKPGGVGAVWALVQATDPGSAANLGAGSMGAGSLGDPLPWCDYVADPPVATPSAPVVTPVGTPGSTTYQYQVVARGVAVGGVAGTTLPGATGQTATGNATLSGTNYNTITWTSPSGDGPTAATAQGFDVLKLVGGVWMLLGSVAAGVFTLSDTGQATAAYSVPTANTTNAGVGGADQLSDAQVRSNAQAARAATGHGTAAAIVAAVETVGGVVAAFVQDAGENGQAAGTITAFFVPAVIPAPAGVSAAAQAMVDSKVTGGIIGTAAALVPVTVNVAYSVAVSGGVAGSAVLPQINSAIAGVFAGLSMGDPVRYSTLVAAIVGVPNVAGLSGPLALTIGGTTYSNADIPGVVRSVYGLGSITATVAG